MARPRIHPEGTTASERARLSVETRRAAGYREVRALLDPEAQAGLAQQRAARGLRSDAATINAVLRDVALAASQEPLGRECEQVLHANLWNLYTRSSGT